MFKSRRRASGRCRENRQFVVRRDEKRPNLEGNSNITSNRVTIPPGFLSLGVRSETVQRSPCRKNLDPNSNFILNEDLQGLFKTNLKENHRKPRRSSRLSRKTESSQEYDSLTASEYYYKDLKRRKSDHHAKLLPVSPCRNKPNNSKSLFRKINERCARARSKHPIQFNYPISAVIGSKSKIECFYPGTFCQNLFREICMNLNQNDYLSQIKVSIKEKTRDINNRLLGKMNSDDTIAEKSAKVGLNNEMGDENDFNFIPKSDWVFETPPKQRVVIPRVDECFIQPAVICTAKKQSNIYELNPNIKVDLTGYSNRQNVPVDGRYMRCLGMFEDNVAVGQGLSNGAMGVSGQVGQADGAGGFFENRRAKDEFMFPNAPSTIAQHFAQVTCRPKKTVKKMSRFNKFYSRQSEGDLDTTPTGVNLFESIEEFERDFTFVEEEGGYKIVNTQGCKVERKFDFKFRKNLFKTDDDKIFDFDAEESKMFDFARLRGE